METNFLETARDLAHASCRPFTVEDGSEIVIVPEGYGVESLERFKDSPRRIIACPIFTVLASFLEYLGRIPDRAATTAGGSAKTTQTMIFADQSSLKFIVILDYHLEPSWCMNKAELHLKLSQQWECWSRRANQPVSQREFANFIEDNVADILDPPAAEMLDVAQTLQAKMNVNFRRGVRLSNNTEQLTYEESIEAKAGQKGDLTVPTKFTLRIPILEDGDVVEVPVRLRYQIKDGALGFTYLLPRLKDVLDVEWKRVVTRVKEATKIEPLHGRP